MYLRAICIDKKHRRSPLVEEGLEIPIKVIIEMDGMTRNKYKQLVVTCQDGMFDDCTKDVSQPHPGSPRMFKNVQCQ